MRSAQRRKRNQVKVKKNSSKWLRILKIVFLLLIIITAVTSIFFLKTGWNKKDKLAYVVGGKEDVKVIILLPETEEIVSINIPGDTKVTVARSLGEWKVKSVWDLGFNESAEGEILAQTITRNFNFPVDAWAGAEIVNLTKGNTLKRFLTAFKKLPSSLSMADKLNIFLYSIKVKEFNNKTISLENTGSLEKTTLPDGSEGYSITRNTAHNLQALFFDPFFASESALVQVINHGGSLSTISNLGDVIGVLGGKITSVKNSNEELKGCIVYGLNQTNVKKLASIFNCEAVTKEVGNYHLVVEIGEGFEKLY